VALSADGLRFGSVWVSAFDFDGLDGVGPGDLAAFAADYFSGEDRCRSDFDNDGSVTLSDLSLWAGAYRSGLETQSTRITCP
jgi:hypothetical protein